MSTLVAQTIRDITDKIAQNLLPPGSKLPSIRQQARLRGVSTFTVVEAYERLVAQGTIRSEQGKGYFVTHSQMPKTPLRATQNLPNAPIRQPFDEDWLLHGIYQHNHTMLLAGCGWLPESWYDQSLMQGALRQLARAPNHLSEYGHPLGFEPLRELISSQLERHHLRYQSKQILLTQGASQALDLVTSTFTQPGDTVLIDAPGYSNLITNLKFKRLNVIGVPWGPNGPDISVLQSLLAQHKPKLFFTNPVLHNPTGASYDAATTYQVVSLAHQHGFMVVENQVSLSLAFNPPSCLSALDNQNNTLFISSFAKALAPSLRVGYVAGSSQHIWHMMQQKMMSGLTTSSINEQLTWHMLQHPKSQKGLQHIKQKLAAAQANVQALLIALGWQCFTQPTSGLFVYARHPFIDDAYAFAQNQHHEAVSLSPGALFECHASNLPQPWFRFNVAYCDAPEFSQWLHQVTPSGQ